MNKSKNREAYDLGFKYEQEYGGCAQATIAALYEVFPELKDEHVFKSATGLGGGVGLTTLAGCGALAGATMVLGQVKGRELANIRDPERQRYITYRLAKRLVTKFSDEYGTVTCAQIQKKLMGRSFNMYEELEDFLAAGGHSTACTSVVGNATQWAAEIIEELRKE